MIDLLALKKAFESFGSSEREQIIACIKLEMINKGFNPYHGDMCYMPKTFEYLGEYSWIRYSPILDKDIVFIKSSHLGIIATNHNQSSA